MRLIKITYLHIHFFEFPNNVLKVGLLLSPCTLSHIKDKQKYFQRVLSLRQNCWILKWNNNRLNTARIYLPKPISEQPHHTVVCLLCSKTRTLFVCFWTEKRTHSKTKTANRTVAIRQPQMYFYTSNQPFCLTFITRGSYALITLFAEPFRSVRRLCYNR